MTGTRFGMLGSGKNLHGIFINFDGAIEIAIQSKKTKAVELVKWLTKKGVEKIQEEHQLVIDEKDATLALINDDLQERANLIQAIQYENVALQTQQDVFPIQLQR